MRRGRRLGVDIGSARIGVATCDPDGLIATPVETVAAGDAAVARLAALAEEHDVIEIVVGLPYSLSGREGPAAATVREAVGALMEATERPVRLVDERLSTVTAAQQLRAGGTKAKKQRPVIDQAAAVVILQNALEGERMRGTPPGQLIDPPTKEWHD
ncbi:MAG: Holliday junction resolvase RuvX [Aeromicrobium sp.]|uniref:Holliday junction resolvase RuvX n=1 Tax=Aeromicrobium sp. TaxID=1871063 RepID=UPI0025B90F38|nr:Holliday junction resolvase RuvX [Aeromicrobium sp.]MCK5891227.1 Holliday junction resolvase RuvX [Aeromicrobium sp.]MDF1705579.1 Holliday junction resolvase RuvX [Aeromicrobium sp.]